MVEFRSSLPSGHSSFDPTYVFQDLDAICGGGAVGGTGVYDEDEDLPSDKEKPYLAHRDSVQLLAQHSQVVSHVEVELPCSASTHVGGQMCVAST